MKSSFILTLSLLFFFNASHAQVPILNSAPQYTNKVIYLDFDGETVSGTSWNVAYSVPTIFAQPAAILNQPTEIVKVWAAVSENFAPFNVNVTTDEAAFNSAPIGNRIKVIITPTQNWYPNNAGGVAYLSSFNDGYDDPCWVFNDADFDYCIAAASHEVGHALSLEHQSVYDSNCDKIDEYNPGYGFGLFEWVPIMGSNYFVNRNLWYNGPNSSDCNELQFDHGNDPAHGITQPNMLSFRQDDVGNSLNEAKNLFLNTTVVLDSGIITQPTDIDVYRFSTCNTKNITFNIKPWSNYVGANDTRDTINYFNTMLDVKFQLFDATTNNLIISSADINKVDALVSVNLNPGDYYFIIDGDLSASYSDYGSIGTYYINIKSDNIEPIVTSFSSNTIKNCVGNAFAFSNTTTGGATDYLWQVTNGVYTFTSTSVNINQTFTTSGTYSVSLLASNSSYTACVANQLVHVDDFPVFTVNSATSCPGQTVTINATGNAANYTFEGDDILTQTNTSFQALANYLGIAKIYTITGSSVLGCETKKTSTITTLDPPEMTVTASPTLACGNQTVAITLTGANSYSWSNTYDLSNNTFGPVVHTSSVLNVTSNSNSIYYIDGDFGQCKPLFPAFVNTNNYFFKAYLYNNSDTLCTTLNHQLYAYTTSTNNNVSYVWSTGEITNDIVVSPTVNTTYSVTVSDGLCAETKTILVKACTNVSVSEINSNNYTFSIKPNPITDYLEIDSNAYTEKLNYSITNAIGQAVINGKLVEGKTRIITTDLNKGIYFLSVQSENGQVFKTKKLVK